MLATTLLCFVVGISDGDTLTARCGDPGQYEQVKVRLQGIDAPERKQPFGERARQALAELTFRKEVELRCAKTDRYKRQVCTVWVAPASAPSGPHTRYRSAHGHAGHSLVVSRAVISGARQDELAEQEAKARKVGLWRDPEPIASWDWRKALREPRQNPGP